MKFIQNILLSFITIILTIILLNIIIVFNSLKIFDQNFLPRHWALNSDRYFLTFYPNTHDKTLKNYSAVLGDSISFGEGDGWVNYENKYSILHYLKENNKKNYLNFSKPGANSITSIKEFIFTYDRIGRSIFLPEIETPNEFIVFFETGDLLANYNSYILKGKKQSIDKFVSNEISDVSNYKNRLFNINFPLFKSSYLVLREKIIHYIYLGFVRKILVRLGLKEPVASFSKKEISNEKNKFNKIIVNSEKLIFPGIITSPHLLLEEIEENIGIKILFESILYLKNNFPDTKIVLVSIPPPSDIYDWVYPIKIQDKSINREKVLNDETDLKKYRKIMEKIKIFSEKTNVLFINPLNELKKIGKNEYIHGKRDSKHPSIKGYEYIANIILSKYEK